MRYRFGEFELRTQARELRAQGTLQEIGGRAFDLLVALVESRDRMSSASELVRIVWPGLLVDHGNLRVQMSTLRRILGPSAILTVPRRGYRFALAVDTVIGPSNSLPFTLSRSAPPSESNAVSPKWAGYGVDVMDALGKHQVVTLIGANEDGRKLIADELKRCLSFNSVSVWLLNENILGSVHSIDSDTRPDGETPATGAATGAVLDDFLVKCISRGKSLIFLQDAHLVADELLQVTMVLLERSDQIRLFCTSRHALGWPQEHVIAVPVLHAQPTVPPEGPRSKLRWNSRGSR